MWISSSRFDELLAKVEMWQRIASENEKSTAYAEAKLDSQDELVKKLEDEVKGLKGENKELLDDLLIASGVKMSKYQEQMAQKELEMVDTRPTYSGQTRGWSHDMTQKTLNDTQEDRNRRAIELVRRLEDESLLNADGLGE